MSEWWDRNSPIIAIVLTIAAISGWLVVFATGTSDSRIARAESKRANSAIVALERSDAQKELALQLLAASMDMTIQCIRAEDN